MLGITYELLDELRVSDHCQLVGATSRSQMQCTALKKLQLERYLAKHEIMPQIHNAAVLQMSPVDLMRILLHATTIEIGSASSSSSKTQCGDDATFVQYDRLHEGCEVGGDFKEKIKRVLEKGCMAERVA